MIAKEAYEFVQAPAELPEDPSTWDASYTGVTDPSEAGTGVIAVLKECASDFADMEAKTQVQEETDQKFFEEEMRDAEIEKASRTKEAEVKTAEMKRQVQK